MNTVRTIEGPMCARLHKRRSRETVCLKFGYGVYSLKGVVDQKKRRKGLLFFKVGVQVFFRGNKTSAKTLP